VADIRIHKHFTDITLATDNPGRQLWWYEVMTQLEKEPFAVIKIGVPMPPLCGAYFGVRKGITTLCLSAEAATFEDNMITFADDRYFAMFVHEASHFQHFCVDRGTFKSPSLINKCPIDFDRMDQIASGDNLVDRVSNSELRDIEYEAGWRAMFSDKKFKLFPGSRLLLEMMMGNLFLYDIKNQTVEWATKMRELLANGEDIQEWLVKNSLPLYKKYSEWADPNHIIKGVLNDEAV